MIKHALTTITALIIAIPLTAIADDDKEYTPTTEIKTIDGKEYVVTYDAVKDHRDKKDAKSADHVHAGLFPIVNHRQHDDEKRTKFLYGPGFALVRGEESDDHSQLEVVKLPGFRLVDVESHEDGRFDNKFLKLPILGSVFHHYKTDNKEKTRFLIFSHTRHFDENGERVKRRHRHRDNRSHHKHRNRHRGRSAKVVITN